jgi:glycosyltransferase involved in cell wall biosynthesis
VRFVGRVGRADVPALLRSADVVACVPWYEPFGIVPLEAMACGVPVVGAAVGGLLDSVVDGETGLLVPPRDPAATAAALGRVLADEELRLRLGRAAAEHVATRFGWAHVAELTEGVYAQLAGVRAARATAAVDPTQAAVEPAVERALA